MTDRVERRAVSERRQGDRRGRGRPRKAVEARLSSIISFSVTRTEADWLVRQALRLKVTVSKFLRIKLVLDAPIPIKKEGWLICGHCGAERKQLQKDHIIPKWKGGPDTPDNIQKICANCHEDKTAEERKELNKTLYSKRRKPVSSVSMST